MNNNNRGVGANSYESSICAFISANRDSISVLSNNGTTASFLISDTNFLNNGLNYTNYLTREGMNIQIEDVYIQPSFSSGECGSYDVTSSIMSLIHSTLANMPNLSVVNIKVDLSQFDNITNLCGVAKQAVIIVSKVN
jgi:hypothetical protein